ncbi:g11617 [Coccomyxa elongata]
MWARTWLACLVLTGVARRVTSARDDLVSYSLGALEWEGDFSDCLEIDQVTDGLANVCNLRVGDLDRSIKDEAAGIIEGIYFPFTCHDGHLAYASLDYGERILWYSREFQDWNINAGLEAKPEEVLAFGSDADATGSANGPLYSGPWWVVRQPALRTSLEEMYTEAKGLQVKCIDVPSSV